MLKVHQIPSKEKLDEFINGFMGAAPGWAVMQPDCGNVQFPASMVVVGEPKMKLATFQFLN
jgi:hypothetical protein